MHRTVHGHSPLYILLLIAMFLVMTSSPLTAKEPVTVRFCMPDAEVYPFFIFTDDEQPTGINPQILNQVFEQGALEHVAIEYVKRPWKRCDVELRNGNVDMIIGSYNTERDAFGLFPRELGMTGSDYFFSTVEVCLTTLDEPDFVARTRAGLVGDTKLTIGVEAGFSQRHSEQMVIEWLVIYNYLEKFTLLQRGRVDAIAEVCSIDFIPIETKAEYAGMQNITTIYQPYLSNAAYAIFSEDFGYKNGDVANTILTELDKVDKQAVYQNYRPGVNRAE